MSPGVAAGGILWLALRRPRGLRLTARGLASGARRERAMLLLWMFTGGMAAITLCPEPGWLFYGLYQGDWSPYFNIEYLGYRVNLIPFSQGDSVFNLVGNVVMFLPFGFFAALLWRKWDGKRALLAGLGMTACIETWQILVGRCFDVDDIILNTLGVFCGYLLWRLPPVPGWKGNGHVTEILELVVPAAAHEEQVMAFKAEMLENADSFDGCAGLDEVETYEEWLDFKGREARKGWSPSHTWLAVRRCDGRLVGIINYRSPLTDFLLQYGGHIGYCVRPSERRKGYATQMLRLALAKCREAGEERVLVTCDKGNTASAKVILANGGRLENEAEDQPGLGRSGIIQRYWIAIQ